MSTLVEDVFTQVREVFDPEIPVNVVDLGLIYTVEVEGTECKITMTLTSQACPEAKTLPDMIRRRANSVEGVENTEVEVVWDPTWGPHLISEEGRKILGIEDEDEDE